MCFCLCFKCLKFFHKIKIILKTVLIISITILLWKEKIILLMLECLSWLPYKRVWVSCVSLWDKMFSAIFPIFWKKVCLGMGKLVQWRNKWIVDSIYLPHFHKGFKVFWMQCLNLCSWRWLWPRRNLVKSYILMGLWTSKTLLAQGNIKFRRFFLKALRLAEFLMLRSSLFHSVIAEEKNELLK